MEIGHTYYKHFGTPFNLFGPRLGPLRPPWERVTQTLIIITVSTCPPNDKKDILLGEAAK